MPVNRLDRGVDINMDGPVRDPAKMPYPFPKGAHDLQQRLALIQPQRSYIAPEGRRIGKLCHMQDGTENRIQLYVNKMQIR